MIGAIPGVDVLGATKDRRGRRGIGVAFTNGNARDVVIFDPETSLLLSGEQFLSRAHARQPSSWRPFGWEVYSRPVIVDKLRSRLPVEVIPTP